MDKYKSQRKWKVRRSHNWRRPQWPRGRGLLIQKWPQVSHKKGKVTYTDVFFYIMVEKSAMASIFVKYVNLDYEPFFWKFRTCVLERRHLIGGASVTEEIVPGFKFSRASYVLSLLRPQIFKDLELKKHGLKVKEKNILRSIRVLSCMYCKTFF